MEWHSDGAEGEATILLGLQDVAPEQGSLRVIPGSHLRYVEGIGHDEVRNALVVLHEWVMCHTGHFEEGCETFRNL